MTIGRHQCGVSIDRVSDEAFSDGSITDCDHIFLFTRNVLSYLRLFFMHIV